MAFRMPLSKRSNPKSHSALGSTYETTAVSNTEAMAAGHPTINSRMLNHPNPVAVMAVSKSAGEFKSY